MFLAQPLNRISIFSFFMSDLLPLKPYTPLFAPSETYRRDFTYTYQHVTYQQIVGARLNIPEPSQDLGELVENLPTEHSQQK